MDGIENVAGASENLTSTTMGSVLGRNTNESDNVANDSLPSSSSDANTAASSVVTQDDPISSTSEEVDAFKKQAVVQQSDSSLDIAMDLETAQIAQQLNISSIKGDSQTNNFEDMASELENLLEESAGDYKYSSKPSKNPSSLDSKDINLDWDLDCDYSNPKLLDTEQNSKQSDCVNRSALTSDKTHLEIPSSSAEILDLSDKIDSKLLRVSSEITAETNNVVESVSCRKDIVEHVNSATRKNAEMPAIPESESALDIKTTKSRDPIESQSNDPVDNKDTGATTALFLETRNNLPSVDTLKKPDIDTYESKNVTHIDEAKNESLESPPAVQNLIIKDSDTDGSKEDNDTINTTVESIELIESAVVENLSCNKNETVLEKEATVFMESDESPEMQQNDSDSISLSFELKDKDSTKTEDNKHVTIKAPEPSTACSISLQENIPNVDATTTSAMDTASAQSLDDDSLPSSSELETVLEESKTSQIPVEEYTTNLDTTTTSSLETANIETIDKVLLESPTLELATEVIEAESITTCAESEISEDVTTEKMSSELLEKSESFTTEEISTSVQMEVDNAETFSLEQVTDIADVDNRDNYIGSTVSTVSIDSFVESDNADISLDETKSTLPSTETASDSSALILTNVETVTLSAETLIEEYVEPSDQPVYDEEMYQNQDLVQDEESYSQEQSFDSYEEQEEDTLESALIKAAVDAEHTRREITAKKQKEKEEEQAKIREQAELMRRQREKNRLEAEKARKLLEEEEQRERDMLNRQIEEQKKLKQEKRLAEEKLIEEKKISEEKKLAEEKKIAEEKKVAEEKKLAEVKKIADEKKIAEENKKLADEKRLTEEKKLFHEKQLVDKRKLMDEQRLAIQRKIDAEIVVGKAAVVVAPSIERVATSDESPSSEEDVPVVEVGTTLLKENAAPEKAKILKPLNIDIEEPTERSNITRDVESTTKDGNISEQPSESEEDNKPEYSSKMSQESLKMTITKNKTDEMDSILKVYDPSEEDQTIRKLKIKPVVDDNVKLTFKNLHEKIPHSPKRSLRNISPNRPQSPKVTIKPIKQESPLKITIKNVGRKSDELESTQQISPKITIKHIINPDEENILGSKNKNVQKEDEEERLHSPKTYKNETDRSSSPKVTIKPVKPDNTETIPKLNIRLNKREQSPKHSLKNIKNRDDENMVEPLKLNIKQYAKECSSISPKITFKPVVRPQETVHESDDDHTTQERIVLKINKSNYQVDSPQTRKREASEDIEKLAKIKLKVSKKPGHAHIINEEMEALKRCLPEGIELVDIKKPKLHIPTHTQGGATITPIMLNEPASQQEELSSDSVIFVSEGDSTHDELIVTPLKSSANVVITPAKRRGRPRKVPLEPRDVPIEEPPIATSSDSLLMVTPSNSNMSLHDGGHFLLSPTGSASGGASPPLEATDQINTSGRPKRSCRGPSAHTQLGIKPRKPRGAGRARGGRGRGHRGGLRGGGVDKPGKFERIPEPKLKLLKETALSMKITDAFDRQDIAIRIVDGVQEQCSIPTTGRRRGGGHDDDSDDDDGNIISGGGGLEIIPRYATVEEDEPMCIDMGMDDRIHIKHGPGKGRIGFLASGVIDITADDSLPPPEDEDDDDEMTGVEEVISSSSPTLPCNLDRQLKIVIGRNDQIGHELIMNKDIVIYEEETRMSADNGSQGGTLGKEGSPAVDPLADIVDMAMPYEDTQSSVQSSATTESAKVVSGADVSTIKTTTRRNNSRGDLSQDDAHMAITSPDQLAEYHWQGDGPFMLQEQIAEYLGVKSFKRKYPSIHRRTVDMQERDYIRDNGLASEGMCNLGLTVLNSADVLDIMYSDFQMKYEEYCKHRRDKEAKEIMNRQRAINLAASQEKTKQDLVQTSISSAAQWNARFNRTRREQRPACMDLQTFTINYAKGSRKVISRGRMGHYPLALVPGQFTDYYQSYTPTEISNLPFNTILPMSLSSMGDDNDSGSESDSSGGSDSGSDSSSGSSGSSSSSTSDDEDNAAGKGQISPLNARSPVAAPSGKRLLAAA